MQHPRSTPPPAERHPALIRYALALTAALVALLLSVLLWPLVAPNPFLLFFGAIALAAWYGGLGPGLVVTAIGLIAVPYFFIPPAYSLKLGLADGLRLAGFGLVAMLISTLSESRRRAERAAHAQREQFEVTLASIGDGVIATDLAGRVTFLNAVAAALTGWEPGEAAGQPIESVFRIVNAGSREKVESPVARVLREGVVVGLANHTVLLGRDGRETAIDDSGAPIRDAQGRVIGAVLVFRDISEREEAAVALQSSESQLRLIADALPALISYLDRDQRYRFNNRAYEEWFGETRAALAGKHIREVVGEAAYEQLRPRLEAALAGQPVQFETLSPYRAGGARYIQAAYIPDRDPDGEVRGAVVLVEDITPRKRAEEGQRLLVAAGDLLAASLDYEATLEQVARLTVPTLADFTIIYLADAAGGITRTAWAHVDAESERLLRAAGPQYPLDPEARLPVTRALRSGEPILTPDAGADFARLVAGDERGRDEIERLAVRSFLVVPMQARGRTLGAMFCATSVSGRRYAAGDLALAEELAYRAALAIDNAALFNAAQEARIAAEDAIRLRDQFLSIASHELKTPLTSLLLQTQLLQRRVSRDGALPEREQRTIAVAVEQAQRLDRMIAALLDISRLELGQLSLNLAPVDVGALARRVVAELQPTSEAHQLSCAAPEAGPTVLGDELRLEQVLQNLLQNAMKYSPDGGPVTVEVAAEPGGARLSVSDRGIGLPEEALPRLFERFYRAPNADPRQISGMGIGLYVVKEIVRLHGGSVHASRQEAGGSRFTVRLPRAGGGAERPAAEAGAAATT